MSEWDNVVVDLFHWINNPIYGIIKIRLELLPEFLRWLAKQKPKERLQTWDRLRRIQFEEHFGDSRSLDDGLYELKWKNGRRVYFSFLPDSEGKTVVVILGGNKNGQSKDINRAKKIVSSNQK
jgi:putative addiction module killer protein